MLKRNERQVFCYDLNVRTRAVHATAPPLADILKFIQDFIKLENFTHEREEGTVIYRIGDINIDDSNDIATILIRRCDMNASTAAYSNSRTGEFKVVPREDEEGGDRAAHLVVSLRQETGKPAVYLCHLEGVPGLSHRLMQVALNSAIKEAAKLNKERFVYPDPSGARLRDGKPKNRSFIPHLEFVGHPSIALIQHLENGKLHEIKLVSQKLAGTLGGNPYLLEKESQIKIKVDPKIPSANRFSNILAAIRTKMSDYQTAKVRFTDPDGVSRNIDCDIATGTPEQQKYIESYRVERISPLMNESSETIVKALETKMVERLKKDRS